VGDFEVNEKTKQVFNGWLALNDTERSAFEDAVRQYKNSPDSKKTILKEATRDSVMKMQTGPLGRGTCACCGR
jgi:hypothetical protein